MAHSKLPSDAHSDQSNVLDGYYKTMSGIHKQLPENTDSDNLVVLAEISIDETYDTLSDEQKVEYLAKKASPEAVQKVYGLLASPVPQVVLKAAEMLLAYAVGKPSQSVDMTFEDKGLSKLSDEKLLRLERELARLTGVEALVIPPMPSKLEE